MTTSGVSNFNPSFDDILQDAAGMVGGGPILAEELQSAQRGMSYVLTQIQNRNTLLHKIETTTVAVSTSGSPVAFDNTISDALHIAVQTSTSEAAITMQRMGYESWAQLTNKTLPGRPIQYWFDRELSGNNLYLWPTPDQPYNLILTVQKTTEEVIRAFQTVDVPRRFMPVLLYGLAYYVGLRRGGRVPDGRLALLKAEYDMALRDAMREDRERASYVMRIGARRHR